MDRAIGWAYLHETREPFTIEKEVPDDDKAMRFIQLLQQAHERHPLTEDYLVLLQNSTVSNPLDKAAAFRHQQNDLGNGLRGAMGELRLHRRCGDLPVLERDRLRGIHIGDDQMCFRRRIAR